MKDVESLRLLVMNRDHLAALRGMAEEFAEEGDDRLLRQLDDPGSFFAEDERFRIGRDLPADRVQQRQFLLFAGERLLGRSRLRHRLIPALHRDGGHIGYEIRASERGNGYATRLLALTLEEARQIGLTRVLLTVRPDNLPSLRVVEKNGGVMDGTAVSPTTGKVMNRYWISLDST